MLWLHACFHLQMWSEYVQTKCTVFIPVLAPLSDALSCTSKGDSYMQEVWAQTLPGRSHHAYRVGWSLLLCPQAFAATPYVHCMDIFVNLKHL